MRITILTVALMSLAVSVGGATPQVSGIPEAASAASVDCSAEFPVGDSAHPEHRCPAGFTQAECWWVWHAVIDGHGHQVLPFRSSDQQQCPTPGCGTAANIDPVSRKCAPHPGAHVRPGAVEEFCSRFYPGDPACGA